MSQVPKTAAELRQEKAARAEQRERKRREEEAARLAEEEADARELAEAEAAEKREAEERAERERKAAEAKAAAEKRAAEERARKEEEERQQERARQVAEARRKADEVRRMQTAGPSRPVQNNTPGALLQEAEVDRRAAEAILRRQIHDAAEKASRERAEKEKAAGGGPLSRCDRCRERDLECLPQMG